MRIKLSEYFLEKKNSSSGAFAILGDFITQTWQSAFNKPRRFRSVTPCGLLMQSKDSVNMSGMWLPPRHAANCISVTFYINSRVYSKTVMKKKVQRSKHINQEHSHLSYCTSLCVLHFSINGSVLGVFALASHKCVSNASCHDMTAMESLDNRSFSVPLPSTAIHAVCH